MNAALGLGLLFITMMLFLVYLVFDSRIRGFEKDLINAIRSISQLMSADESLHSALVKYSAKHHDSFSKLCAHLLAEVRSGSSLPDVLEEAASRSDSFLLRYFFGIIAHAERKEGDVAGVLRPLSERIGALKEMEGKVLSELDPQVTMLHVIGVALMPFLFIYTAGVLDLALTGPVWFFLYFTLALYVLFDWIAFGDWRKSLIQAPLFIMVFWAVTALLGPIVVNLFGNIF